MKIVEMSDLEIKKVNHRKDCKRRGRVSNKSEIEVIEIESDDESEVEIVKEINKNDDSIIQIDEDLDENPTHNELSDVDFVEIDLIRSSVLSGANVNARDSNGNTLLHDAIKKNYNELIPLLVHAGADITVRNNAGETVLSLCTGTDDGRVFLCEIEKKENVKKVQLLKDAGALVTVRTGKGEVVLHAVRGINVKDSNGNTELHRCVTSGDVDKVKSLIDAGSDVTLKNNAGKTPLEVALDYENLDSSAILRLLVEAGSNVNTKSESRGVTVLHEAARFGDAALVRLLVDRGADVNAKDNPVGEPGNTSNNWTPLHYAAVYALKEDTSVFEILLSANAHTNAQYWEELSPLHLVLNRDKFETRSLDYCNIFKLFQKYGADFHADSALKSPVQYALDTWNVQAINDLILCGILDVNKKYKFPYSQSKYKSLLHASAYYGNLPLAKLLLKNGADIDESDENYLTPLQKIIYIINLTDQSLDELLTNRVNILKCFLKYNPNVNVITFQGDIILTVMGRIISCEILWKTLLEHLAKLQITEKHIHPRILSSISEKSYFDDYFKQCNQELKMSKNSRLHPDSWVTLFDLLMDDKKNLFKYAGNADLIKVCKKKETFKELPIFGQLMRKKFLKALRRRKNRYQAGVTLSKIFLPKNVSPEHGVIIKILNLLNKKDWIRLSEVMKLDCE